MTSKVNTLIICLVILTFAGCSKKKSVKVHVPLPVPYLKKQLDILDYQITPTDQYDKSGLMFSDQGAWFAYSLSDSTSNEPGFSGPFLMTQQNGVWSSPKLTYLDLEDHNLKLSKTQSFGSHLEQIFISDKLELKQRLVFLSGHTALIKSQIKNIGKNPITINYLWKNKKLFADELQLKSNKDEVIINSSKSEAVGHLLFPNKTVVNIKDSLFVSQKQTIKIEPNQTISLTNSQSFIFPEYSWEKERKLIKKVDFDSVLRARKTEKNLQLESLVNNLKPQFKDSTYELVLAKAHLTLQNNWRIPAGEIKHEGLFPSYHYKWFNGFWSWDSWKHSVGLSYYNTDLAKKQVRLMFEFQNDDGFVADCVYRDTTIEAHNYRDTKPPLSAWAVRKIYQKDKDVSFVIEMYPKLKKYHYWWYHKRDHDQDGLCEYGSTDGTLVAAKWESGMDNAIRFDNSKILKNSEGAYSLDQESVDLNAYLYAEKLFLADMADILSLNEDAIQYKKDAEILKLKIQQQFYDKEDGWFYDTNLEGTSFIKGEGSEGWTALWANAATQQQAEAVKNRMMDSSKFYTKVPFQTMSADHEKFDPLKGYWRGPNWLDQAYFGVKGLRNYGFHIEADKATIQILRGAEGVLGKGKAIRENYHPLTGKGLHAQNFSWSAAHIITLLISD